MSVKTFADLLYPITPEAFFKDYYQQRPLHIKNIKGEPNKVKALPDWDEIASFLNRSNLWSAKSLNLALDRKILQPIDYCTPQQDLSDHTVMRPNLERVEYWLKQGASMVLNRVEFMSDGLNHIAGLLEDALQAKVQCNLYASSRARQAFNSHFDTHDVFALHTVGEKRWKIYTTRRDFPIPHRRFDNAAFTQEQHQQDRGEILIDVTMRPGDLLYIPRGQYHDALATNQDDQGSVHIAFGVNNVMGIDIAQLASDWLIEDRQFRMNLPRLTDGKPALAKHLAELGDGIASLFKNENFIDKVHDYVSHHKEDRRRIALPIQAKALIYQVATKMQIASMNGTMVLKNAKGAVSIPADKLAMMQWVVAQKQFDRYQFMDEFGHIPTNECDQFLHDLNKMGVIATNMKDGN